MEWTESLNLEKWMLQIFAGTPEIFAAIALLVITSLAATFRMNTIGLFFMVGMFLLMFSGFINSVLLILIAVIGGLVLGYLIHRIFVI